MKIKTGLFALIVGGLGLISLLFFVYAFTQRVEADLQAALAFENAKQAMECSQEVQKLNQLLNDRTQSLQLALDQVAQNTSLLEEQASKSKNKK